jgi:hypothetical protein
MFSICFPICEMSIKKEILASTNLLNLCSGSWGKRDPAWNNLKGLWGKRSVDARAGKMVSSTLYVRRHG